MNPPFKSYPKISDSPEKWTLDANEWRDLKRVDWVVSEKIHGANFSFITDGSEVFCAKRKSLLEADSVFFSYQSLVLRYKRSVLALSAWFKSEGIDASWVTIHGELFGGGYPHPDVPVVPGVQPVQTGVWYAPGVEFCGFDIAVTNAKGKKTFLDFHVARRAALSVELPFSEPLFIGRLGEATQWRVSFQTELPKRFGLPEIEDNWAEGVVVKPVSPIEVQTRKGIARPMVKCKPARFMEDARYHQAEKWAAPPPTYAGALDQLLWTGEALLEHNRFAAARSKLGEGASKEELTTLLMVDIFTELQGIHPELVVGLDATDTLLLESVLEDSAIALVTASLQVIAKYSGQT